MRIYRLGRCGAAVASFPTAALAVGLVLSLTVSCAVIPRPSQSVHAGRDTPLGSCADFFAAVDDRVVKAQTIDPGAFRVDNFPYLRTNRFLASFSGEVADEAAFSAWVYRMMALDRRARRFEIANTGALDGLSGDAGASYDAVLNRVSACGNLLRQADVGDPAVQSKMTASVHAPDDYIQLRRWLGLYPLTRLFVSLGVSGWHRQAREKFSNTPPLNWRARRYHPQQTGQSGPVERLHLTVERDALGIPVYAEEDLRNLFRMFAPVWEIQDGGPADRIGRPYWKPGGTLDVDINEAVTYTLVSFTRFAGRILTQLNYIVWFPERPRQHLFDLYGGLLDGLIYRVTLDADGTPLLYDTVHNCGCYYKAYPTDRLTAVETPPYAEPPLVLTAPDLDHSKSVMAIAMETGTHYVNRLYPVARRELTAGSAESYPLREYGELRSLEMATGERRSMFGQNSIARGSERLERLILWPTGVYSPGAMRQWGRHAVAFAGKRHFDDPFYMDKMFRLK